MSYHSTTDTAQTVFKGVKLETSFVHAENATHWPSINVGVLILVFSLSSHAGNIYWLELTAVSLLESPFTVH